MTDDLIKRLIDELRACGGFVDGTLISVYYIADALESQAKLIEGLRMELTVAGEISRDAHVRAENAEERVAELEGRAGDHDLLHDMGQQAFIFHAVEMRERYDSLVARVTEEMARLRAIEASSGKRVAELEGEEKRLNDLLACFIPGHQTDAINKQIADATIALRVRAEKAEAHLGNLLAMLHRDGGHYQCEHGTDNAVGEATLVWSELILRAEKAEADLALVRSALDEVDRKLSAQNHGTSSPVRMIIAASLEEPSARVWNGETKTWVDHLDVDGMRSSGPVLQSRSDVNWAVIDEYLAAEQPSQEKSCKTCRFTPSICGYSTYVYGCGWQPKSDVCPTCEGNVNISMGNGMYPDCTDCEGTGKKEPK
jgi:hypothetical protein